MGVAMPHRPVQARGARAQDGLTVMLVGPTVPQGLSIPCHGWWWDTSAGGDLMEV